MQEALRVGALDVAACVCAFPSRLKLCFRPTHFVAGMEALAERAADAGELDLITMCAPRACALRLPCCPSPAPTATRGYAQACLHGRKCRRGTRKRGARLALQGHSHESCIYTVCGFAAGTLLRSVH